jgi:hypothetical protein
MISPKIFITGIPTAGKSYLANKLAEAENGIAVNMDDYRESLKSEERYKKWINFYLDQDEEKYLKTTSPSKMWENLVAQSETLWPAFLKKIGEYQNTEQPVIFECVNILPHLAHHDLAFPGVVLIGHSYEEILERNRKNPRWSGDSKLQELEAHMFFEVERPRYESEAKKYGYPIFEGSDDAFKATLKLIREQINF